MSSGMLFDIKEFSIHDGPGIRLTVFLKGCPLNCLWCHNPEGILPSPETIVSPTGERAVGMQIAAAKLANRISTFADIFQDTGGGVTFSGGEPLLQSEFVEHVISYLPGIHILVDTCGYCNPTTFKRMLSCVDMFYYDLKIIDPVEHRRFCGVDNRTILDNFELLKESAVPFVLRVPLIPGITDNAENLKAIAERVSSASGLLYLELLPYNKLAGGKYPSLGRVYSPTVDENSDINYHMEIFQNLNIEVRIA